MSTKNKITGWLTGCAIAGLTITAAQLPAQAAAGPNDDCKQLFPVSSITVDQPVTGLTVSKGTTPEEFTGKVLGVLDDGIAPGVDMIMMRLTSPEIDRVGIWRGMSGSPVYAEDGRLIGAVAYGLGWGSSPVAGITPFEEMNDYSTPTPARIAVNKRVANKLVTAAGVSQRVASSGFTQLPTPLSISGISRARLAAEPQRGYQKQFANSQLVGGGSGTNSSSSADLIAGGNLAASLSYGDLNYGGVGTVTSVCEGRVVGFGHPMRMSRRTDLFMSPASVLYVQENLDSAFKVANYGQPAGTVTDDHLTGITGTLGTTPAETLITSNVTFPQASRSRIGETHIAKNLAPGQVAGLSLYHLFGNYDRVYDGWSKGSAKQSLKITGTQPNGNPFEINYQNNYVNDYDITEPAGYDAADLVYLVKRYKLDPEKIEVNTEFSTSNLKYSLAKLQIKQGTRWVKVSSTADMEDYYRGYGGSPIVGKRGGKLQFQATLTKSEDGSKTVVPFKLTIPTNAKLGFNEVMLRTGLSDSPGNHLEKMGANPYKQILNAIAATPQSNQFGAEIYKLTTAMKSKTFDRPISGGAYFELLVR